MAESTRLRQMRSRRPETETSPKPVIAPPKPAISPRRWGTAGPRPPTPCRGGSGYHDRAPHHLTRIAPATPFTTTGAVSARRADRREVPALAVAATICRGSHATLPKPRCGIDLDRPARKAVTNKSTRAFSSAPLSLPATPVVTPVPQEACRSSWTWAAGSRRSGPRVSDWAAMFTHRWRRLALCLPFVSVRR